MPLVPGSSRDAVSENIRTERSEGRPQRQAVAIALNVARQHRALGGFNPPGHVTVPTPGGASRFHTGPIKAPVAGRTDHIPMKVRSNSYVLPADVVSALGEGNTEAGQHIVGGLFKSHPIHRADGGGVDDDDGIDIIAAGGEHVLSPEQVAYAGEGDVKNGHDVLDSWVKMIRKQNIKTLQKLPGPVRD